ncbi:hypothetical protein ACR6C2_04830 [Streptomyces sp. INA 01156]
MLLVLSDPVEGREDEYNEWYSGQHLGETLQTRGGPRPGDSFWLTTNCRSTCPSTGTSRSTRSRPMTPLRH